MNRIIGIDLGTSTSEVAYFEDGNPVLIPNHLGKFITPSVVNIKENGDITVGEEALDLLLIEPECTFAEVKAHMGTDKLFKAHGKTYTAVELSSFILKYLLDSANEFLGEEIKRAVITVPAYFSDLQRRQTIEAGEICGLTVERIINEPTSAALSYGINHMQDCTNILIYDLGGGTLDVTVLEMFEGVVEVKASSGDNKLGGKYFDEAIMEYVLGKFSKKNKTNIKDDLRAMARLKKEVEYCKITLSKELEYKMELAFFTKIDGKPVSLNETITREKFEELISKKIDGTEEQIEIALSDGNMKIQDIDLILLVGGSTRIPYVEKFISKKLNKEPKKLVDPDLAVVLGAAVQAGIIGEQFEENEIILTDVCPFTLGTAVLNEYARYDEYNLEFSPIIPRNTTIPTTMKELYYTCSDRQTEVEVKVYQGEHKDPRQNRFLNSFNLSGIPKGPVGKEKISIAFSYDLNGILQVEAEIISTGEKAAVTINVDYKNEIDVSLWKTGEHAKLYKAIIRSAEKAYGVTGENDNELYDMITRLKEGIVLNKDMEELDEIKEEILDYLLDMEN